MILVPDLKEEKRPERQTEEVALLGIYTCLQRQTEEVALLGIYTCLQRQTEECDQN